MDKLQMAHDWAMRNGDKEYPNLTVERAWDYADAMQAEADKRKETGLPKAIKDHLDKKHEEWQPDWSQAPDWANWYAVDKNGQGIWHNLEPSRDQSMVEWVIDFSGGSDFSYKISPDFNYQGDWKDSLRKRP